MFEDEGISHLHSHFISSSFIRHSICCVANEKLDNISRSDKPINEYFLKFFINLNLKRLIICLITVFYTNIVTNITYNSFNTKLMITQKGKYDFCHVIKNSQKYKEIQPIMIKLLHFKEVIAEYKVNAAKLFLFIK